MVVSLSQNMLSPARYGDGIDNVKTQRNTVNNSEGNGNAQKSTDNKEGSHRDPPSSSGNLTEQQSSSGQGKHLVQLEYMF